MISQMAKWGSFEYIHSELTWGCPNKLNEVDKKNEYSLIWVPGYLQIAGNEEANRPTGEGKGKPLTDPEPCYGQSNAPIRRNF